MATKFNGDARMVEIYVALLDEGTTVWRPVAATEISNGVFQLAATIPRQERWQFGPGEVVRCELRQLSGDAPVRVAVERVAPAI